MGYTPKHAKPASLKEAALSHGLTAINTPSIGRHAVTASTAAASTAVNTAVSGAEAAPAKAA